MSTSARVEFFEISQVFNWSLVEKPEGQFLTAKLILYNIFYIIYTQIITHGNTYNSDLCMYINEIDTDKWIRYWLHSHSQTIYNLPYILIYEGMILQYVSLKSILRTYTTRTQINFFTCYANSIDTFICNCLITVAIVETVLKVKCVIVIEIIIKFG